ncbi:hypothetical protein [Xanthomonas campestris]|uniref:hypothetical protein n=1 Tax=Xanthomonas campestris TaxID=339 RepID=UPI00096C8A65|nr:hypothetical protein [Xanthomonas campestris]MCC5094286.1 hypothetical protein [Xanthomonas campestris pv. incanae]MEA9609401.1 hypothetical protein [Xanthomonas campestris pv. incanae]MEA9620082.1 hypothetical protein [Xanthomonas campestris pv. incanae]WDJ10972.1 hypothetical protein JH299_05395 [Xanthomonas campestris pv. incanae]
MEQGKASQSKRAGIVRVLWKEILPGDLRKFAAQSHDADTGGGARDLRFRGDQDLKAIILDMFPVQEHASRRRNSVATTITRHRGQFCWNSGSGGTKQTHSEAAYIEPPTSAREGEWRITRVHTYGVFQGSVPAVTGGDRVLLLLIQTDDGNIWPRFTTETSLRKDKWSEAVKQNILGCLDSKKSERRASYGFFDLQNGRTHCHV